MSRRHETDVQYALLICILSTSGKFHRAALYRVWCMSAYDFDDISNAVAWNIVQVFYRAMLYIVHSVRQ